MSDPVGFFERVIALAGPAAKKLVIAKLRPMLEPHVTKRGLAWEDVLPILDTVDTAEELQQAMSDPAGFFERLIASAGPVAKKLAMAKLRPMLEPHVTKRGLAWEDVLPILDTVDTAEEL